MLLSVYHHHITVTRQLINQIDKLVISQLGLLAQRRLARGVRLNHAEATVCIPCTTVALYRQTMLMMMMMMMTGPDIVQSARSMFLAM
jgi:urease gamma subunit